MFYFSNMIWWSLKVFCWMIDFLLLCYFLFNIFWLILVYCAHEEGHEAFNSCSITKYQNKASYLLNSNVARYLKTRWNFEITRYLKTRWNFWWSADFSSMFCALWAKRWKTQLKRQAALWSTIARIGHSRYRVEKRFSQVDFFLNIYSRAGNRIEKID